MILRTGLRWTAAACGVALSLALTLAGLSIARAQDRASDEPSAAKKIRELWFFFSPGPDLSKDVRALGALLERHPNVKLRPYLLVEDFGAIEAPPSGFAATLSELRSHRSLTSGLDLGLAVLDEEGLAMARRLEVEALPAYAVIGPGERSGTRRAHVCYGRGARLEELLTCK